MKQTDCTATDATYDRKLLNSTKQLLQDTPDGVELANWFGRRWAHRGWLPRPLDTWARDEPYPKRVCWHPSLFYVVAHFEIRGNLAGEAAHLVREARLRFNQELRRPWEDQRIEHFARLGSNVPREMAPIGHISGYDAWLDDAIKNS